MTSTIVSHQTVRLRRGKHASPEKGVCVMELASMLAGEPFSDRPQAVCPVIGAYLRSYNDVVDDERRQDLYAYAAEAIGTSGSPDLRRARAERAADGARRQARAGARRGCARRGAAGVAGTGPMTMSSSASASARAWPSGPERCSARARCMPTRSSSMDEPGSESSGRPLSQRRTRERWS